MSAPREKFQSLLRELFQIESAADLDFGIYRIMGQKRAIIERFIDEELLAVIGSELKTGAFRQEADASAQLEELAGQIREILDDDALDAEGNLDPRFRQSKLGKQYLALQAKAAGARSAGNHEATIYNHLYHFFSRYYDQGDFMSLRRYSKREKYAIPYNGEEVHLHWANADQYYIKTGENFTDYRWKDPSAAVRVRFTVTAADVPKDNIKAPDKRYFLPQVDALAVEALGTGKDKDRHTLVTLPFHYRGLTDEETAAHEALAEESGTKKGNGNGNGGKLQAAILTAAAEALPKLPALKANREVLAALLAEHHRDADGISISRLAHHLRRFTVKNTSDYFIHKDLGGFLTRELDFYLKNEVLHLDTLEAGGEDRAEGWFQMMRVIRALGAKIIAFLAQIENFQKRLFEKKKFVTECHYCLTLDRVPEELYPEIAKNSEQIAEWKKLFAIDEAEGWSEPPTVRFLRKNWNLVVDTRFFAHEFETRITCADAFRDEGLLIKSENYQALAMVGESYANLVNPVYIDPPYNTGSDDNFSYKDHYQRSTWLSLIKERIALIRDLQPRQGTMVVSIDDDELSRLVEIGKLHYGECLATLVWDRNRKNDAKQFSIGHEYMCVFAKDKQYLREAKVTFREPRDGLGEAKELFEKLQRKHRNNWEKIREGWLHWLDDMVLSDPRRRLRRFTKVGTRGPYRDDGDPSWPGGGGPRYEIKHPTTEKPVPVPKRGWVWATAKRFWEAYDAGDIIFGADHTTTPGVARYAFESEGQVMPSVFYSYAQTASQEFDALWGEKLFEHPKNWRDIARMIRYLGDANCCVLDCFAGSGTTAHSVINLNREDNGKRQYVLVEVGDYFDALVLRRAKKVTYSSDWKDGKPTTRDTGISHCFKYLRLESYEDALGNIAFNENEAAQRQLDFDEYVIHYMLAFETGGSETLLDIEKLCAPFDYKLEIRDGDESKFRNVDLPETFNFLLGLRVRTRKVAHRTKGKQKLKYLVLRGRTNPHATGGEREVVVIWRTTTGWKKEDFEADRDFIAENGFTEGADEVFVNSDSIVKGARALDPVFKRRMFNLPDGAA